MRTTLTIDDDVAALLADLQKKRKVSRKVLVNDALRRGLIELRRAGESQKKIAYRTPSTDAGKCYLPSIDSVSRALAFAEGDDFR